MEASDLQTWAEASRSAVELLKSAYALLPKGRRRDEIADKIKLAEEVLKRSDAKLAKDLGMRLCPCTWPPQIMLWHEKERVLRCPNGDCGREWKPPAKPKRVISLPYERI